VVWVKRWALDTRDEIDGAGMIDPRVTHLWDTGTVIGQGFLDRFGVTLGGLDYDFFLLFDRDATLGQQGTATGELRCHGHQRERAAGQRCGGAAPLRLPGSATRSWPPSPPHPAPPSLGRRSAWTRERCLGDRHRGIVFDAGDVAGVPGS
jgi:hypothetical protein